MNQQELNRTYDQITEQLNKLHTIVSGFQKELGSFLNTDSPPKAPKKIKSEPPEK